jgi:hypothetical protein
MTEPLSQPVPNPKWSRVGFWWRALAWLIDMTVMFVLITALVLPMHFAVELRTGRPDDAFRMSEILSAAVAVFYWMLEAVFITPGKFILRMRIRNIDDTAPPGWRLGFRWALKQAPLFFGFLFAASHYAPFKVLMYSWGLFVFIGCLFAANDDRLAWHDRWFETAVYPAQRTKPPQGFEVMQSPHAYQ